MKYDLIILDMDGTLLNSKSEVSDGNRIALERAIKGGVNIAIATGRIFTSARSYAELLGIYTPIIACNGALIRNYSDLEVIYSNHISMEDTLKVIELCNKHKLYFHIYDIENLYVEEDKLEYLERLYWRGRNRTSDEVSIVTVKDMYSFVQEKQVETLKFVLVDEALENLANIRVELEEIKSIDVDKSWHNNLEVMNKGVSKGKAIGRLSELLSIPKERLIAFGDNYNDISMKDYVGTFVAMGNSEAPVKQRADYITSSNDEDGVAAGIIKLVFEEE